MSAKNSLSDLAFLRLGSFNTPEGGLSPKPAARTLRHPSLPIGLRRIPPSARILRDSRISIATAAQVCAHSHRLHQPPSYRKGFIQLCTASREGKKRA